MLDVQDHLSADVLSDYLRGELAADSEARVESHIGTCLVCARQLREEAQLEVLLHEAHEAPAAVAQPHRRALWQRVAATVANTAAAAAALLLVINPSEPLGSQSATRAANQASHAGTSVSASAFINEALCFPSADTSTSADDDNCEEPMTVAMVSMETDPDDYLSPFDGSEFTRGSALNACLVEDLACEPS